MIDNKPRNNNAKMIVIEIALTVLLLGFIGSGLLGGANEIRLIHLPVSVAHWIGALLIAYVIVITGTAVHLGVKFALKKG